MLRDINLDRIFEKHNCIHLQDDANSQIIRIKICRLNQFKMLLVCTCRFPSFVFLKFKIFTTENDISNHFPSVYTEKIRLDAALRFTDPFCLFYGLSRFILHLQHFLRRDLHPRGRFYARSRFAFSPQYFFTFLRESVRFARRFALFVLVIIEFALYRPPREKPRRKPAHLRDVPRECFAFEKLRGKEK